MSFVYNILQENLTLSLTFPQLRLVASGNGLPVQPGNREGVARGTGGSDEEAELNISEACYIHARYLSVHIGDRGFGIGGSAVEGELVPPPPPPLAPLPHPSPLIGGGLKIYFINKRHPGQWPLPLNYSRKHKAPFGDFLHC